MADVAWPHPDSQTAPKFPRPWSIEIYFGGRIKIMFQAEVVWWYWEKFMILVEIIYPDNKLLKASMLQRDEAHECCPKVVLSF